MSSYVEQPPDENLIEETRRQINALVEEIAGLARQNLAPGQFYEQFLNRLVSALAAIGGVVWAAGENNQLALQYQLNLQHTGLLESEEKQQQHSRLLYKVLNNPDVVKGNGVLVPPHSGFGEDNAANATGCLLVFGPLRTDLEMVGLVEIFQRPDVAKEIQEGYLRFVLQMCELATDFLKSHQLRHFSDRQVLWARLEDFTRGVHASLEPLETAYTIANEARRLIECDRVSVALRKGNRCTIEAVSGQDVFDKRSNTVRLLGRLASAVVATGEPVWYAGETRDLAPQVEDAVQEYVDDAHSKMIAVLPLGRPKPDHEADEEDKEHIEEPVGALIVEQIEDNRVAPAMAQRIDVVCKHSSIALANAMEHQNLFLMPLWRAIGKSRFLVQARTLPKTVLAVVAVVVVLLALFLFPADFDLHANGTLEPAVRSDIYTNADGQVAEFEKDIEGKPIDHGSWVKKGQVLLRLVNPTLERQKADIDDQLITERSHYGELEHERTIDGLTNKADERARLMGQMRESEGKIKNLEHQAKLFESQINDLEIRSPIDGQILTWDLKNHLDQRPVKKGDFLLRVADTKGPWELDLNMTDDRMGHIARQENLVRKTNDPNLQVTYQTATAAGKTLTGTVKEISLVANPEKEEGNVVVIRVNINKEDIDPADRKLGATVSGKVHCGRRSLGYVWFHELFEFIQTKVFFRFL
jgi:multidrug efflux pump subunit AcrA (membrane-fusion protein)